MNNSTGNPDRKSSHNSDSLSESSAPSPEVPLNPQTKDEASAPAASQNTQTPIEASAGESAAKPPDAQTKVEPFTVTVRPKHAPSDSPAVRKFSAASPVDAFRAAMGFTDCHGAEPILSWPGRDKLAALDIDYHGEQKPQRDRLALIAAGFPVQPVAWWTTHGGGLRMIFAECDGFTAHELAAIAWYHFRAESCRMLGGDGFPTGIEVKSVTRHPHYPRKDGATAGGVWYPTPSALNIGRAAGRLLGSGGSEISDDDVYAYLEERGWTHGTTLPHTDCPIDPTTASTHEKCVAVLEGGLYCHKCAAAGLTRGSNTPGFVPYTSMIDGEVKRTNHVRNAVKNFTHWVQAQHVIKHFTRHPDMPDRDARALYRALLKLWHLRDVGPDESERREAMRELIGRVFFPELPIVRLSGRWSNVDNIGPPARQIAETMMVSDLPALCYIDEKAKIKKKKPGALLDYADLTKYGYPALTPIRGVDLIQQVGNPDKAGDCIPFLVRSDPPHRHYTAQEREQGDAFNSYREYIARAFPGVNFAYLKLLIGAATFAQLPGQTEPPRIIVTGASGTGKTTTVDLAAELLGGTAYGVRMRTASYGEGPERWLRAYEKAANSHVFAITDECAKLPLTSAEFGALALAVRVGSDFHRLHQGSEGLTRLIPHVYTDTQLPSAMQKDSQLRRRFIHVELIAGPPLNVDWKQTSGRGVTGWRKQSELNAVAGDMLVSEVVDELRTLTAHGATVEDYARELGFTSLRAASGDDHDPDEAYRALFVAAVKAALPAGTDPTFKGEGWCVFDPSGTGDVADAWRVCAEDGGKTDSQPVTSNQWGLTLNIPGVRCEVRTRGRMVALRFCVGKPRSTEFKAGRAVIPDGHALIAAVEASAAATVAA